MINSPTFYSFCIFLEIKNFLKKMAQAFNPSTREAEAGGSLWVWGQPGLQSADNQDYTKKPCLKKQN